MAYNDTLFGIEMDDEFDTPAVMPEKKADVVKEQAVVLTPKQIVVDPAEYKEAAQNSVLGGKTVTDLSFEEKDTDPMRNYQSGIVRQYLETGDAEFPCLVLSTESVTQCQISALQAFLSSQGASSMGVYIESQGAVIHIGYIERIRLRALLNSEVLRSVDKSICLDENTRIGGESLYALCPIGAED